LDVKLTQCVYHSDQGPNSVPENLPIEGWPAWYDRHGQKYTLGEVQRNPGNADADCHAIIVDPVNRVLYEFYQMKKTADGRQATQASIFDLKTNKLRPDGRTSIAAPLHFANALAAGPTNSSSCSLLPSHAVSSK
jgi:hypothetical protein